MMNENIGECFINGETDSIVFDVDADSDIFKSNEEFLKEAQRELNELYKNGRINPSDIRRVMGLPQDYYQEEEVSKIKEITTEQKDVQDTIGAFRDKPIRTGYIPVEYNYYNELIRKAKVYDDLMIHIDEEEFLNYISKGKTIGFSITEEVDES